MQNQLTMQNIMEGTRKINLNLELSAKNPPTVKELRQNCYKVKVHTQRFPYNNGLDENILVPEFELEPSFRSQKGGQTTVYLTTPDGKDYVGEARCNKVDPFNRRKGVKIALGRICKQIEEEFIIIPSEVPV